MPLSGQTMSVTNTYTPGAVITASGFNTNFTDFATSLTTIATTLQGDLDANGKNIGFDTGTGILDDSGNEQLLFIKTASAVNYFKITNAATGGTVFMEAAGGDSNVTAAFSSKGTGSVILYSGSNSRVLALFVNVASAVNYWLLSPAGTGGGPRLQAFGTDTNIDANFSSTGTGSTLFYSGGFARIKMALSNVASSVNFWTFSPSATGNAIIAAATGSDTNIIMRLDGKGTGGVMIEGTATNDDAAAGYVGEYVTATVASGSAVPLTTATAANVTSISLTAGDWDVWGNIAHTGNASTINNASSVSVTTTSATQLTNAADEGFGFAYTLNQANGFAVVRAGPKRISISGTTTVYLVATASFSVSTLNAYGTIRARRVR